MINSHSSSQGQNAQMAVVNFYDIIEKFQQKRCVTADFIQSYGDSDIPGAFKYTICLIVLIVGVIITATGDSLAGNWGYAKTQFSDKQNVTTIKDQEPISFAQTTLPFYRSPAGHSPEDLASLRPQLNSLDEALPSKLGKEPPIQPQRSGLSTSQLLELALEDDLYWSQEALSARVDEFDKRLEIAFRPKPYEPPYRRLELEVTGPEAEYLIELRRELETTSLRILREYFQAISASGPFTQADYSIIEYYLKKAPLEEIKIAVDQIDTHREPNHRDKMILKAYR